jgi:hypothetical protein
LLSVLLGAFTLGAGLICRSRLSYRIAVCCLIGVFAGAFLAWVVGGLLGVSLPLSSVLFDRAFGLPGGAYTWVGGSIDGGEAGSLLSLVAVLVRLHSRRRKSAVSSAAAP